MTIKYSKPPLTVDQQIDLLESRGLNLPNRDKARHYLQFINYYRLSGYTISFEQIVNGRRGHQFIKSWLHSLTYIRNLCAHHSRLWNRHFTITPKQLKPHIKYFTPNTTFAAQAAMMHLLLEVIHLSIPHEWGFQRGGKMMAFGG